MTWETVLLGELVQAVSGRAGGQHLPVYSVTKHSGFVPSREYFKKQVFSTDLTTYKIVDPGQFAYATIHLDEGSIGIAPERCVISPMYTVFSADPTRVHGPYLLRYLKSPVGLSEYPRLGRGTAERRKSISLDALGRIQLVLPPLAEQRRIAAILDEADQLRTRATDRLRRMDEGARAAVAEIVGDAPTSRPLGSLIGEPLRNGISPSKSGSIVADVLTLSAITRGDFDARARKTDTFASLHAPDKVVRKGLHLICRGNGNPELVGTMAVVTSDLDGVAFPDTMIAMRPSSEISSSALDAAWRSRFVRDQIGRGARTTNGTYKINQQLLAAIQVPVGSPAQQEQIGAIEELRARLSSDLASAIRSSDALFASLQHRAFRGEL
ncbi:hypothetical protein G3N30_08520 [Microbacterium lacticum]|uniref:restriction endonuclease subunit S n=1 Tax=Microbacterium lacticum TaxID=33885 RepID=UPI0018B09BED|nr:hypothetical protein [Microbacterium lacticum]